MRNDLRPFVIARVAVCVAALLSQATLLPLAHAGHAAGTRAAAERLSVPGDAPALHSSATPIHDAASCIVCTAFANSRTGALVQAESAAAGPVDLAIVRLSTAVWVGTAAPTAASPRAPPSSAS